MEKIPLVDLGSAPTDLQAKPHSAIKSIKSGASATVFGFCHTLAEGMLFLEGPHSLENFPKTGRYVSGPLVREPPFAMVSIAFFLVPSLCFQHYFTSVSSTLKTVPASAS